MAEKASPRRLQVLSCAFCRGGHFLSPAKPGPEDCLELRWDADRVAVSDRSGSDLLSLEWRQVSSVWACVRARTSRGFTLEVALEASGSELEFVRFNAAMGAAAGELLGFLQDVKADKLKEDHAPRFVMSQFAAPLYGAGLSAHRLRVALGWCTVAWEVLFALCFFMQLEKLVVQRERRLLEQLGQLWGELLGILQGIWFELHDVVLSTELSVMSVGRLFGYPGTVGMAVAWKLAARSFDWLQLLVLAQHLLGLLGSLRGMWSIGTGVLRSVGTFRKAAGKAHKSLGKLSKGAAPADCGGGGGRAEVAKPAAEPPAQGS